MISGAPRGVVVIEAEIARARDHGEDGGGTGPRGMAVPGSPLDPRAKGTND